jgi:hypothetical protein
MLICGATATPVSVTVSVSTGPEPCLALINQLVVVVPREVGAKVTNLPVKVEDLFMVLVGFAPLLEKGELNTGNVTVIAPVWSPRVACTVTVEAGSTLTSKGPKSTDAGTVIRSAVAGAAIVMSESAELADVRIVLFTESVPSKSNVPASTRDAPAEAGRPPHSQRSRGILLASEP